MFTKPRIYALLVTVAVMAICLPLLGADDGDAAAAAHAHNAGFFERNYVLTELIVMPILALLMAGAMASNTTTERIETKHRDFFNQPLGKSYTDVPVSKEPSSPSEIRNTLIVMGVIYLALRLTCLSGCFSSVFQLLGSFIDIFLR